MEGQTCQICWVGTLVLDAGLLVCDTCGGTVQVSSNKRPDATAARAPPCSL